METKNAWEKFEQSGKIADYMAYSAAMPGAMQNVKYSAAKATLNTSKKVNLPANMVTKDMNNADKNTGIRIETT